MIKIDDAGTGSCFGTPVIVGYREETKDVLSVLYINKSINSICAEIINYFNPTKEEEIEICRGHLFTGVVKEYSEKGYNIIAKKIDGEFQDIAEQVFMEQLYSSGLSKTVELHGKDYVRLHNEILEDVLINPKLINIINSNGRKSKQIHEILRKLDRLTNEFPNLYETLRPCK